MISSLIAASFGHVAQRASSPAPRSTEWKSSASPELSRELDAPPDLRLALNREQKR